MQDRRRVRSFEDLLIWQMGIELVKRTYCLTAEGNFHRDFGLKDQIRRASLSIPTNIAEGFELSSRKEYLKFLNMLRVQPERFEAFFELLGGLAISKLLNTRSFEMQP